MSGVPMIEAPNLALFWAKPCRATWLLKGAVVRNGQVMAVLPCGRARQRGVEGLIQVRRHP